MRCKRLLPTDATQFALAVLVLSLAVGAVGFAGTYGLLYDEEEANGTLDINGTDAAPQTVQNIAVNGGDSGPEKQDSQVERNKESETGPPSDSKEEEPGPDEKNSDEKNSDEENPDEKNSDEGDETDATQEENTEDGSQTGSSGSGDDEEPDGGDDANTETDGSDGSGESEEGDGTESS